MDRISRMFQVEQIGNVTKITNDTEYVLLISIRPIPPKRKYVDVRLIPPGQFIILEAEIDLSTVSFRLENDITKAMK